MFDLRIRFEQVIFFRINTFYRRSRPIIETQRVALEILRRMHQSNNIFN